eukprot:CAMPEP_0167775456 /NCGR_PEP_ID=MMETSP0111_2-20121227/2572_1 /TAXON_ID=91324 /ORGANISM="Lotharella globosa, Strain CCCM811" /LENGTH=615 /DNA_ID=CAMNT_0007665379 /DNA_START=1 /DNA_END=1845 /DNA_ORIENTATION=+
MGNDVSSPKAGDSGIVRQGPLTKKGGWRRTVHTAKRGVKTWKKRYFVLTNESLVYYNSKKAFMSGGGKPAGTLTFDEHSGVQEGTTFRELQMRELGSETLKSKRKQRKLKTSVRKHEFVVTGFEGNLFLRADTEDGKKLWMTDLKRRVEAVKNVKTSSFQNLLASFTGDELEVSPMRKVPPARLALEAINEAGESKEALINLTDEGRPRTASTEKKDVSFVSFEDLIDMLLTARPREKEIAGGMWTAFLIYTHTCYSNSQDLMNILLDRMCNPPKKFSKHIPQFQERVINLLFTWLKEHSEDFERIDISSVEEHTKSVSESLLPRYEELIKRMKDLMSGANLQELVSECSLASYPSNGVRSRSTADVDSEVVLQRGNSAGNVGSSLQKRSDRSDVVRRATIHEKKLGHFLRKFAPELMDIRNYDLNDLCAQLMHVDMGLIRSIHPRSMLKKLWKSKNAAFLCPDLMHAIATWNKRCYWVATAILMDNDVKGGGLAAFSRRAKAFIKRFLHIARKCVKMGNYYCASCILCSLKMQCIRRLTPAWDLLSKESNKDMEFLEEACSRKSYWERFDKAQDSREIHLPHLPLVLDALYQIEVKFTKDSDDHINLSKYKKQW